MQEYVTLINMNIGTVQRGLEGGNMKSEMFRFRRVY